MTYYASPVNALSIYPEFDRIFWKFNKVPRTLWQVNNHESNNGLIYEISTLKISNVDEWYRVSKAEKVVKKQISSRGTPKSLMEPRQVLWKTKKNPLNGGYTKLFKKYSHMV